MRANLYDVLATSGTTVQPRLELTLKVFVCPSDSGAPNGKVHSARHFDDGYGATTAGLAQLRPGVSNYLGVAGHRRVDSTALNSGVFYGNSDVTLSTILDGTSTTALVGERDTIHCRSGSWIGIRNSTTGTGARGTHVVTGHSEAKLNQPDPPVNWNANNGCGEGFSSLHPDGALFLFADGSVRFLSDRISHNWVGNAANDNADPANGVYQRLLSRADGLTAELP